MSTPFPALSRLRPWLRLAALLALPCAAHGMPAPNPELDAFRGALRTYLEDVRRAATVALDAEQFEASALELEELRTARDFEDCRDRRWFHSRRHQLRACRAIGHAVGTIAERQRQALELGRRRALREMGRAGQLVPGISPASRRQFASLVRAGVTAAFSGLGEELDRSVRDFEAETRTDCGAPESPEAVECSLARMVRFLRERLPEDVRHARLELEQLVRETGASVDGYVE